MELFRNYIIQNFVLLCVFIVMLVNCIQYFKRQKKVSLYLILITLSAFLLSIFDLLEKTGRELVNVDLVTAGAFLGYVTRPVVIFFFILLSTNYKKKWVYPLLSSLLFINFIIFLMMFIPGAKENVVYYTGGEKIGFNGGIFRFTSHIISAIYLLYLIYVFSIKLRLKQFNNAIAIFACVVFVVLAVIIETLFNDSGDVYLLNITIVISALTYFLYSYIQKSQIDALTGLYNRETYYRDLPKMNNSVTGIIQFDLNGLKYINDHFGHLEGDKALNTIAQILLKYGNSNYYAYRLGGDEFTIIVNKASEEEIIKSINFYKEEFDKTNYHCSIGYSYRHDKSVDILDLIKDAEKNMYRNKEEFYKTAKFDRRKI